MDRFVYRFRQVVINYLAAMTIIVVGYFIYLQHPYYVSYFNSQHKEVFWYLLLAYALLLPFYYLTLDNSHVTKSRLFWNGVIAVFYRSLTDSEKLALRAVAVKVFFLPLMLAWLINHSGDLIVQFREFYEFGYFFPNGYWVVFNLIFIIDVGFFTIGYAIEHPKLGNEIRSVEPTALGWIVTLICYPPFNGATQQMLGWYTDDYPNFDAVWLQYLFGFLILGMLVIYAWASVALNFKASNLTHRGVIAHGPYGWVRHPAYIAKNIAWWLGSIPILMHYWQQGQIDFFYALLGVLGWSAIYYLRAMTEERHLSADPEYLAYCRQVNYRFIPGVW